MEASDTIADEQGNMGKGWEQEAGKGRFEAIPEPFEWEDSIYFAHMMSGYELMGFDALADLANGRLAQAKTVGWQGTTLELWACLFFEHRRYRHVGSGPAPDERVLLDALCSTLRARLIQLDPAQRRELLRHVDPAKAGGTASPSRRGPPAPFVSPLQYLGRIVHNGVDDKGETP